MAAGVRGAEEEFQGWRWEGRCAGARGGRRGRGEACGGQAEGRAGVGEVARGSGPVPAGGEAFGYGAVKVCRSACQLSKWK